LPQATINAFRINRVAIVEHESMLYSANTRDGVRAASRRGLFKKVLVMKTGQNRFGDHSMAVGCPWPILDRRLGEAFLGRCPFLALSSQQRAANGSKARQKAKVENRPIL
jgi:hypothetical protein